jgi:hypothetical protein
MIVRVLGPLEVAGQQGEPVSIGGQVPRRLLCALVVRPGAVVPVSALLDAVWGDAPPASAERTLVSHVTRLRVPRLVRWSAGTVATAWLWTRARSMSPASSSSSTPLGTGPRMRHFRC